MTRIWVIFGGKSYVSTLGAWGVDYNGPVAVKNIDVPAFKAPANLAGQEQEIIASVLEHVQQVFSDAGVIITSRALPTGLPHSVVYVGGDSSAFARYGVFNGLAGTSMSATSTVATTPSFSPLSPACCVPAA